MKVFISWSGALSNSLAESFRTWLPGALQSVKPYFTPSDIEKGSRWSSEISKELEASDVGILFITRENITSSWLIYEAGALSKRLEKSKVCPVIFGISPNDLPGPLRQFQATEFNKDDFHKLLKTINQSSSEIKLGDSVLDEVFEMWWPRLEQKLNSTLSANKVDNKLTPIRPDRDLLEEILELSRLNSRRISARSAIAPEAVSDLVNSIVRVHHEIQGITDPVAAMNELAKMKKPLDYLMMHMRNDQSTDSELMKKAISELRFEYVPPDEDDIPF